LTATDRDDHPTVAISPDGRRIATFGRSGPVKVWDTETLTCLGSFEGTGSEIIFSPDGENLAVDVGQSSVVLYDIATRRAIKLPVGRCYRGTFEFSASGRYLLVQQSDDRRAVINVSSGSVVRTVSGSVDTSAFGAGVLVRWAAPGQLSVEDAPSGREIARLE